MNMEYEYKPTILELANNIQFNIEEEAKAIENYNNLLAMAEKMLLSPSVRDELQSIIYEIIGDELNHQTKLKNLYSLITSIKESKD